MPYTSAREIYQTRLDPLTQAIMAGNVSGFVSGIMIPHELRTIDTRVVFRTSEELRQGAEDYFQGLRAQGVTRLERICESAVFLSDTEIEGYNSVRSFAGEEEAILPYLARMRMEFRDGDWKIRETDMAVLRQKFPSLPLGSGIQPLPKAPTGETAFHLACFQVLLNWLSQAALSGDFDSWQRACGLPFTLTSQNGVTVLTTDAELRREFELYCAAFDVHGVTDIIRQPLDVTVQGETQMIGTCRTYVLRNAEMVVPPYESKLTLQRNAEGLWQMRRYENALGHRNWSLREGGA